MHYDYFQDTANLFDAVDVLFDFEGYIVGMGVSGDSRWEGPDGPNVIPTLNYCPMTRYLY